MEMKIINNVKPFNDIFYKDCFFNSLFPIVNHFNKSVISLLIYDTILYCIDSRNGLLNAETITSKNHETILKQLGINSHTQLSSNNILSDIISGLNEDHPIIIWIDSFYEPFRLDTYLKEHWSHTLLIYGYDNSKRTLNIIEHKHKDSLLYKELTLSYSDLVKCYQSYIEHFLPHTNTMSFFQYYMDSGTARTNIISEDIDSNLFIFANNISKNIKAINIGLGCLKNFLSEYEKIVTNESEFHTKASLLLENINNIIKLKQLEKYRMIELDQHNLLGLSPILEIINNNWEDIRLGIGRYIYSEVYDRNVIQVTLDKLYDIYMRENQYKNMILQVDISSSKVFVNE